MEDIPTYRKAIKPMTDGMRRTFHRVLVRQA